MNTTPPDDFSDIQCKNEYCIDGMVPEYLYNEFGDIEVEIVKCKFCNN